jgi:hypothetical protein
MAQDTVGSRWVDANSGNLCRSQALFIDLDEFAGLIDGVCPPSSELADGRDDPIAFLQ